jgi:hypothetical protein
MAFSTVEGKVSRVFFDGKGAEIVEEFTVKGKDMTKRWTAWFDAPHGLTEGSTVKVSGLHSDEINEWEKDGETRRSVKRSLNKARIEGTPAAASQAATSTEVPF